MFEHDLNFGDWDFGGHKSSSHWFRKLLILGFGAAAAFFYAQYRAKQSDVGPFDGNADGWQRLSSSNAPSVPEPEPVVDVASAETHIVENFVLSSDVDDESVEIDLALEEDIENGDIDEHEENEEFDPENQFDPDNHFDPENENEVEGVLNHGEDDQHEESILEPSPRQDPPRWKAPVDGKCPEGFPIKARFSTGRFHVPEDKGYKRVIPDCCYATREDALADGYTPSRLS